SATHHDLHSFPTRRSSDLKPGATTYDFFELFFIGGRNFQHREKGFLRNINLADALHAAFALFLFFEELAFARDVAAVAFGQDVRSEEHTSELQSRFDLVCR